ncbi:hypothetical protein [Asticcacaulis sp. 201]|uniref:hypothetical protein n=1 Tax=Asticcacaulis sp. 201 TaxID=3028787 RepID=UPI002916E0F3|nr:hypothetical protein [Asticcacaulis sp. 201]MDV6331148.1 hypothetical protein [Asticcacaulis sp. 201]
MGDFSNAGSASFHTFEPRTVRMRCVFHWADLETTTARGQRYASVNFWKIMKKLSRAANPVRVFLRICHVVSLASGNMGLSYDDLAALAARIDSHLYSATFLSALP